MVYDVLATLSVAQHNNVTHLMDEKWYEVKGVD